MKFGSVCSGIEAASVAWEPLGWKAAWFSEIEKFPCAVLSYHYPDTPNLGDMTTLPARIASGEVEAPDLFCGGTPCQAFSVAGMRQSLEDARGNLSLTFCEIADAIDHVRVVRGEPASIVFWENVPGVLSTKDNAFGCFLGALAGTDTAIVPGGRWTDAGVVDGPKRTVAWRTLDAQYFGVAQRRKRVFVVASARDDFDPAAVLFEFEGLRRDTAPSRKTGQIVAPTIAGCSNGGGSNGPGRDVDSCESLQVVNRVYEMHGQDSRVRDLGDVCSTVTSKYGTGGGNVPVTLAIGTDCYNGNITGDVAATMGTPGSSINASGPTVMVQPIAWDEEMNASIDQAGTLLRGGDGGRHDGVAVAFQVGPQSGEFTDLAPTLDCRAKNGPIQNQLGAGVMQAMQVRRLTPIECERLQGFPDNYTNIKDKCPDGPRYKALGNSWAVPVVHWIGARIQGALNAA